MAEVYSNSFLTIAAAHAKDDSDGFLDLRSQIQVPIDIETGKGTLYVSKINREERHVLTDIHLLDDQPLHERGWTLQERYLSRRTLHYTKYQMFWECNEGIFAERGDYSPRICSLDSVIYGDRDIELPWFPAWLKLVERYSCRKLTVASDRLPALSGITSRLGDAIGDQYCAGIWQSRMLYGLSWRKSFSTNSTTNSQSEGILTGPSWSWASVSHPVLFYPRVIKVESKPHVSEPYVAHATVLSHRIEPEGESLYGAVRSGRLTIRGPVLEVEPSKDSLHLFYWDRGNEEEHPCYVLSLWSRGLGDPLNSDCQARGLVGLIVKPTSTDHREFRRIGLVIPRVGGLCKGMYYKAEDVREIILV